jgi:hypothetical protein
MEVASFGNRFTVTLLEGGRRIGRFSGSYAARSDFLESDGFRMHLKEETRSSLVEIASSGGLAGARRLSFLKEGED